MIVRHTTEQVSDYYEKAGLNQSSLKVILEDGMQEFLVKAQELAKVEELYGEKKHFIIGSGVDCKITHGEDIFEKQYHISRLIKKPGETALAILKLAYDKAKAFFPLGIDISLTAYKSEVYEAANELEYYMNRKKDNWEDDTRINELLKQNGQEYWADLYMAGDKQVLSDDEANTVEVVSTSLLTHPHTAHLFNDDGGKDIIYQFVIDFIIKNVHCKGMIDEIIIDHVNKRIMPVDIKTTAWNVLTFPQAIKKRRYDLQASFYLEGLKQNIKKLGELIKKDLTGYTVSKFAFVVESTKTTGTPMIFVMDEQVIYRGQHGSPEEGIKGWQQGIDEFIIWADAGWDINKVYEKTNGVIFVDTHILNFAN